MGGRLKREGIDVYTQTIDFVVEQKLTQHCKAIILQLKEKKITVLWGLKVCLRTRDGDVMNSVKLFQIRGQTHEKPRTE